MKRLVKVNEVIHCARNILSINYLYHGSTDVVKQPDLRRVGESKDFGWGFYCTTVKSQAEEWAERRSNRNGKPPIVNVYSWNPGVLNTLNCLEFIDLDNQVNIDEWATYCVSCRTSREQIHNLDIVAGPLAFDKFNSMLYWYAHDPSDEAFQEIVREVKSRSNMLTQQIAFCTDAALKSLNFIEYYQLSKKN